MTPRASVLLSAYDEELLVGEAIGSVLAQTLTDFELIVVDDGSGDRTAEVVEGFLGDPRLRLIRQENRGLAAALNVAAAAATAPRLALIDADDLWFPNFLEQTVGALEANPGAGFAHTDAWWLQQASGRFFRRSTAEYLGAPPEPPRDPHELLLALLPGNWIFGLTAIDRAAFERAGGFDESLSAAEDYELWLRLLAAGREAIRVPGRLAVQRDRSTSMSADEASMLRNLEVLYTTVAGWPDVPEDVRTAARARAATVRRRAARGRDGTLPRAPSLAAGLLRRGRKRLAPWSVWHRGVPAEVRAALPQIDFSAR